MAQQTAATLPNVTVTATMAEHDVRTAPASVSVVDRKELDARMPADLMEAIQDEPGVGFDVISTAGRKTLSLRGMESKHILMMIDGKRIAGSDDVVGHSDYSLGWVPMVAVERVEVIRGPMSTLYGSEALGGVVNMITREPTDEWRTSVLLKGGTQTDRSGGSFVQQSIYSAGKVNDVLSLKLTGTNARNSDIPNPLKPEISELEGRHNMQGGAVWAACSIWRKVTRLISTFSTARTSVSSTHQAPRRAHIATPTTSTARMPILAGAVMWRAGTARREPT